MSTIPGIAVKRNAKGKTTHIAIDLRKHPDIVPMLQEQGLLPKSQWEVESKGCLTQEEALSRTLAFVDRLWEK